MQHPGRSHRPGPTVRAKVVDHRAGHSSRREDRLVTEEPLEVRCSWPGQPARRVAVTMRTPGHDFELAAGLLHAEGAVGGAQIDSIAYCTDPEVMQDQRFNVVTVHLDGPADQELPIRGDTVTAASSACGVCGVDSIEAVVRRLSKEHLPSPVADPGRQLLDPVLVGTLPERLREQQKIFGRTGGLHAAGLFGSDGRARVVREDVGRHNAVDKVVGHQLLAGALPAPLVLVVSGRLGFEITQKAAVAQLPIVVAVGAPSSLSVELAHRAGVTLVGFAGPDRFVTYTHPARLGV